MRNNNFGDNVTARQRFIVTIKGHPVDVGPLMFKIVGPDNKTVQLRKASGIDAVFKEPFRRGATEVKAWAILGHGGRYQLIEIVEDKVVPKAGIEPATARV
jgi:hypothetical protein